MTGGSDTRRRILKIAADIARSQGAARLTFDAVAKRLGTSKQAVIYWFPRKEDLIAAVAVPAMRAEAEATLSAMSAAPKGAEAVRAFVRAVAAFHFADFGRFRLMYIAPLMGAKPRLTTTGSLDDQIHALTSSIYDELQTHLRKGEVCSEIEARRAAVAVHMAALGLVMMVATTDAMGDPLLHDRHDMVETMAWLLSSNAASKPA